jgi:predicted nucleic acid-binding Zn ribbon protein
MPRFCWNLSTNTKNILTTTGRNIFGKRLKAMSITSKSICGDNKMENNEKLCLENYEMALSQDCAICSDKECPFRKTGNPVATLMVYLLLIFVLILIGVLL